MAPATTLPLVVMSVSVVPVPMVLTATYPAMLNALMRVSRTAMAMVFVKWESKMALHFQTATAMVTMTLAQSVYSSPPTMYVSGNYRVRMEGHAATSLIGCTPVNAHLVSLYL